MKNSRSTDSIRLLALLSLGEVGHHVDLSSQPELKTVILDAFSSSSEEVSQANYKFNFYLIFLVLLRQTKLSKGPVTTVVSVKPGVY